MYMLTMVLVLLGYLAVWRAVERPTLGPLAGVALVTAALLYTQYWAFFLVGVVGVDPALGRVAQPGRGAARPRSGSLLAVAVGGLLFVPWLPDVRCTRCSTPGRRGTRRRARRRTPRSASSTSPAAG